MTGPRSRRTRSPRDPAPRRSHVRPVGELDLDALRARDRTGLLREVDQVLVYDIPLTTRFRGLSRRDGVLLHGPAGWGEAAPFWDYDAQASAPWLAAALAAATGTGPGGLPVTLPGRRRGRIDVNVTVPEVGPYEAWALVSSSCATTAKVKVGTATGHPARDLERLEAVRDALGPGGRIRIDVNGAWDLDTAQRLLPAMDRAAGGLEYVEQPCTTVTELADLRRTTEVPVAADESVRLTTDPLAVRRLEAADVVILKVAPLGGVVRALRLADRLGLPAVVSSALDTSVGLARGVELAATLPELDRACGLGTARLLRRDVAVPSVAPDAGVLEVRDLHVSRTLLTAAAADADLLSRWRMRLEHVLGALADRREREAVDPGAAVAGIAL